MLEFVEGHNLRFADVTPIGMLGDAAGLHISMYVLAGLAAVTGLASFLLPETRRR